MITEPDRRGTARWEDWLTNPIDPRSLDRDAAPQARFDTLEAPLSDGKTLRALKTDFVDWIYRKMDVTVRGNTKLKVFTGPKVSQAEFRRLCADAARDGRDAELKKVETSYDKKLDTIEDRLKREERELRADEAELRERRMEEYGTHAENMLSLLSRRRKRLSTSLTKRRLTEQAKADVEESIAAIEEYERQINDLEYDKAQALQDVNDKWADIADDMEEIPVRPYKKDILVDLFGVAWLPYHIVQAGGRTIELAGFGKI